MSTKKLRGAQLRKFRSDVAKLKKRGLLSARVDARSQKPTYYMRQQVAKFRDVLDKKASVITAPSHKEAKAYSRQLNTKFNKIVIPKKEGLTQRYNKKTHQIEASGEIYGNKVRRLIAKVPISRLEDLPEKAPSGRRYIYRVPFNTSYGTSYYTASDKADLIAFMTQYKHFNAETSGKYVELFEVLRSSLDETEGQEDDF